MPRGDGRGARQPLSARKPGKAAKQKSASPTSPTTPSSRATTRRTSKKHGEKPSQKAPPVARAPRTQAERRHVAEVTLERLSREYPDAHCELDHRNAFELLGATILSAQCTDARVNQVTPTLFERYPSAAELSDASLSDVEEIIRSTGFFRAKAKSLVGMAKALVHKHRGEVPAAMDDLVQLPGVGRKTANVVLGNAFQQNEGVVVDTHVQRLSRRLGLTREPDAIGIEKELMRLFPRESWALLSHLLIWHGRRICLARKALCSSCVLNDTCASAFIAGD